MVGVTNKSKWEKKGNKRNYHLCVNKKRPLISLNNLNIERSVNVQAMHKSC